MTTILILEKQAHRRDHISRELEKEGYTVAAISEETLLMDQFDPYAADLLILNLYPDSFKAWLIYNDFKKHYPDVPVLICMLRNIYALKYLKTDIRRILKNSRRPEAAAEEKLFFKPDNKLQKEIFFSGEIY